MRRWAFTFEVILLLDFTHINMEKAVSFESIGGFAYNNFS